MIALTEGQAEVGGLLLGDAHDDELALLDVDQGTAVWTDQDRANPVGNNRFFGRDQVHGPTWTLTILINQDTAAAARRAYNRLVAVWRTAADPSVPGSFTTLRHHSGGETRRVYGRPRAIDLSDTTGLSQGVLEVVAQFVTLDALSYQDEAESVSLRAVSASTGGFVTPFVMPLTSERSATRQGVLDNTGDAPTPFEVVFAGPATNPAIEGDGWELAFDTVIPYDQWITVDTRRGTALRSSGGSAAGDLRFGSYLSDARIQPGLNEIAFTATDPTGTATATVNYHPAAHGI